MTFFFIGLHRREIIVYSICTGFVSFILFVCTFLLRRYKQRSANHIPSTRRIPPAQLGTDIGLHVQATGTSTDVVEGIYETIDESSLIPDLQMSVPARNEYNENSGSSSDDNSDPLPNDGYLNPYQPIMQEFVKHGYSTTTHKSDLDCSSSDESDSASGYLNPYQTIVPDQDKHEYYKVYDDSRLVNNHISDFSNESTKDAYTDAHSYTQSKNTGHENQSEGSWDMDKEVQTQMCVTENKLSHNEYIQTCDIELKLCINEHGKSTDKFERVGQCLEVRDSNDSLEATCHLDVI